MLTLASRTLTLGTLNFNCGMFVYSSIIYPRFAAKVGVKLMTFDDELELPKVKELFPTAELVLRIFVDDSTANARVSSVENNECSIAANVGNIYWNSSCYLQTNAVSPCKSSQYLYGFYQTMW